MWKRKKNNKPAPTKEQMEEHLKRLNFGKALEMLCTKMGKSKEFFRLIRRRDPDATLGEISEFRRKMVRLLAFNYDVHRRPDPALNKRLMPADRPDAEPIIYPPEWKEAKTA